MKKLDYESVAEHIPEAERKLLVHIRKEHQRKAKRGQSELGSEVSEEINFSLFRQCKIGPVTWTISA